MFDIGWPIVNESVPSKDVAFDSEASQADTSFDLFTFIFFKDAILPRKELLTSHWMNARSRTSIPLMMTFLSIAAIKEFVQGEMTSTHLTGMVGAAGRCRLPLKLTLHTHHFVLELHVFPL